MRILQVAKYIPLGEMTGGQVRTLGVATALSKFAEVDLLALGSYETASIVDGASPYRRIITVPAFNFLSHKMGMVLNFLQGASLQSCKYINSSHAHTLLSSVYDVVHAEELAPMAWILRAVSSASRPLIYSAHNYEGALASDGTRSRRLFRRIVTPLEEARVTQEEHKAIRNASGIIYVSEKDFLSLHGPVPSPGIVVPNCPSSRVSKLPPVNSQTIVCIGCLGWWPNEDGALWFMTEVLPLLKRYQPGANVVFVGSLPNERLRRAARAAQCLLHGDVPNVLPYLRQARAIFVPLRSGGGTRIKIVEAWASGVPVVSTTCGAEGLNAQPNKDVLLADTAEDFAAALDRVISDEQTYLSLRESGLARAEEFSWCRFSESLCRLYHSVLHETHV